MPPVLSNAPKCAANDPYQRILYLPGSVGLRSRDEKYACHPVAQFAMLDKFAHIKMRRDAISNNG